MVSSDNSKSDFVSIHEASSLSGVSISTIRRRIKNGRLPAKKVKGRYGEEYLLGKEDVKNLKRGKPIVAKSKLAKKKPAIKTGRKTKSQSIKREVTVPQSENDDFGKIATLQNQEIQLVAQKSFDREKFRQNWRELGRLIETKITEGQMQVNELQYILQEKERLLALKDSRINNLTLEIKDQAENIKLIRKQKSLLRHFSEYLRGLFSDPE